MLASFIVRLVITDGGSIRHGLMQCSIAFSIARQGRRTQARGALCVEMGFTWTFPRNQDVTVKLKSELISIKF